MVKCSFCGKTLVPANGKMFVKTDGKILYFCSSKCEKNMLTLKRKGRAVKWTDTAAEEKKKTKSSAAKSNKK